MPPPVPRRWLAVAAALAVGIPLHADDDIARSLKTLRAVGPEGKGNEDAGPAWKALVAKGGPALLPTLAAMKDADPAAVNWLRTAADAVAEGERTAGRKLPAGPIAGFVTDTANAPAARRQAFELLRVEDAKAADTLLASLVEDPSLELRRDAIERALKANTVSSRTMTSDPRHEQYLSLFKAARDKDQVEALAKELDGYGKRVSVTEHFGYVTHWYVVGPFDSPAGKGFATPFPPESAVDLAAKLKGKGGVDVAWKPAVTADKYATVDLNAALGKSMDAAGYALATLKADKEQPVEVRVASQNAVQIFLNGKKLFEREEYHHGERMDQHVGKGTLKAGENQLLVKVCQNNQSESWAQKWAFQARVCDATGGALPVTQVVARDSGPKVVPLGFTPAVAEGKK